MHDATEYLSGLAQLHQIDEVEQRRALWRQGMASLAAAAADQQPAPLEGLSQEGLLASARVALATGLVDDLGFLSRPVAAAAIFELAAALPAGTEKRDLGRRVLKEVHEGDAATFVALATSLTLTSRRALAGAVVRSRVALSLRLPISSGTGPDGLALALLARPELERDWLTLPSTGSLPSRRLTARLLERAAREAVRRAASGDPSGLRIFERPEVRVAWNRLLADRESLVWRHVASARGILASSSDERALEIDRDTSPQLGPTEWRRAAASLAAQVASDPEAGLARCRELLAGEVATRDPGICAAMVFGLVRAGEEEPEAVDELLPELVRKGGVDAIEALVELREEHPNSRLGAGAAALAAERLRTAPATPDDGLIALAEALHQDLDPDPSGEPPLRSFLAAALVAFTEGRRLIPATEAALDAAHAAMSRLEGARDDSPESRRATFRSLRDLDMGLLETATLHELLVLAAKDPTAASAPLAGIFERLGNWLIEREQKPDTDATLPHFTLRLRRLRTLLHLFDVDAAGAGDDAATAARDRRRRNFLTMAARLRKDPPESPLRRTLCATIARAADALERDEVAELGDIFIAVLAHARTADDLRIFSEASILPEAREMYAAAAIAARPHSAPTGTPKGRNNGAKDAAKASEAAGAASAPQRLAAHDESAARSEPLEALRALTEAMPAGASVRVEGLRRAFLGITRALQTITDAEGLADLGRRTGPPPLERLEESVRYAAKLMAGARRRLGIKQTSPPRLADSSLRDLDAAIDRNVQGEDEPLGIPVAAASASLQARLPRLVAEVAARVLSRLPGLPAQPPFARRSASTDEGPDGGLSAATSRSKRARGRGHGAEAAGPRALRELRLPHWLPPSRILGGFFVVRPLGTGAGGSVFVVRRSEERHDNRAGTFALKIPAYNGSAAHTLSEEEFLQLFREEAGALLTLPRHTNLAGFVTFDAGARPKPILVMELVPGPTLERLADKRELNVSFALAALDGIAKGLAAMHAAGVAHLDIKPANIILRTAKGTTDSRLVRLEQVGPVPVLVDFGLAGRKVRPGCGSPFYGGPEVWDANRFGGQTDPRATDVYAFSALAYELLTGRTLFSSDSLPGLLGSHLSHDGDPPGLGLLRGDPHLAAVADVLRAGLAADPSRRAGIEDLREALASLAPDLESSPWPVVGAASGN